MRSWGDKVTANIKVRERQFDSVLEPHLPVVIRLDGCGFKSFTKPLNQVKPSAFVSTGEDSFHQLLDKRNAEGKKAFDIRFTRSMISTAIAMVEHFQATFAYTVSDEITLVLPPAEFGPDPTDSMYDSLRLRDPMCVNKGRTHIYSGRQSKINSITAAFATSQFNYHFHNDHSFQDMVTTKGSHEDKRLKLDKAPFPHKDHLGYFDARTMTMETAGEVLDLVAWRQRFDGERNVINRVGQYVYGHKQISGHSKQKIMQNVAKDLNLTVLTPVDGLIGEQIPHDWQQDDLQWFRQNGAKYEVRPEISLGALIKKEQFQLEAVNQKTNEKVVVDRGRICCRAFQLPADEDVKNTKVYEKIIFSKYWPSDNQSSS